jgi:hypothetical protein
MGLAALREDRAAKPSPGESCSKKLFQVEAVAQLANAITTLPHSANAWSGSGPTTCRFAAPG